jgi:hypothetical protein
MWTPHPTDRPPYPHALCSDVGVVPNCALWLVSERSCGQARGAFGSSGWRPPVLMLNFLLTKMGVTCCCCCGCCGLVCGDGCVAGAAWALLLLYTLSVIVTHTRALLHTLGRLLSTSGVDHTHSITLAPL